MDGALSAIFPLTCTGDHEVFHAAATNARKSDSWMAVVDTFLRCPQRDMKVQAMWEIQDLALQL